MTKIVFYFLTITLAFKPTYSGTTESCLTPLNQSGSCVSITKCSALFSIFKIRPLTTTNVDYLRTFHCGYEDDMPKVCCILLPTDTCGTSSESKIVGGKDTELDEFPWMALLGYEKRDSSKSKKFRCGGALISNRYVLTAAHCAHQGLLQSQGWDLKSVRLGEYNTDTEIDCVAVDDCAPPAVDFAIKAALVHEDYVPSDSRNYHDIALLRLNQEVRFSDYIKPICLPIQKEDVNKSYVGEKLFVAGWGKTQNSTNSKVKLKVQVPGVTFSECNEKYSGINIELRSEQMCAGGNRAQDACTGDSGGPLMTVKSNGRRDLRWYAVGFVSFGLSTCGAQNWPGVYINTAYYTNWILSKLKP